jgi:hypothetical protein
MNSEAMPVRIRASDAVNTMLNASRWITLARLNHRAMMAKIAMFAMLLPNTPPAARSGASVSVATVPVVISGSDVAPASRSAPIHTCPIPV